MLPRVDYLTVHTPLTDETRGLVGTAQLEKMKPGVRLINAARGGIYDEAALAEGLKSGKIGGVALDVYATEPCTDSPLFGMPGVVCTPHLGASTEEAQTQVAIEAVELACRVSHDGRNSPCGERGVARSEDVGITARLFGCGPSAGHVAGRHGAGRHAGVPAHVSRRNRGEGHEDSYRGVCRRAVAGALDQEVNMVNAELVLKQRGIKLTEESRTRDGVVPVVDDGGSDLRIAASTKRRARSLVSTCRGWWRSTISGWKRIWTGCFWYFAIATCRASSAPWARFSAGTT